MAEAYPHKPLYSEEGCFGEISSCEVVCGGAGDVKRSGRSKYMCADLAVEGETALYDLVIPSGYFRFGRPTRDLFIDENTSESDAESLGRPLYVGSMSGKFGPKTIEVVTDVTLPTFDSNGVMTSEGSVTKTSFTIIAGGLSWNESDLNQEN